MSCACGARLAGLPNACYRHGARSKETIALWKFIKSLR